MSENNTPTSNTQGAPSPMELVQEFHRTYSVPIRSFDDPTLSYERLGLRVSLIAEEFALERSTASAPARSLRRLPPRR